jgi:predicted glycosyltransferase
MKGKLTDREFGAEDANAGTATGVAQALTMNREAAAMGVPVYSIFRGKIGAVDRYLAEQGRLTLLATSEDVRSKITVQSRQKVAQGGNRAHVPTLETIVDTIESILEVPGQVLPA